MATIRKLPSGSWNVQIRRNGKLIATSTHKRRELAVAWTDAKEKELSFVHCYFLDAGYSYCHQVLEKKPSQRLAINRIDRICKHSAMQQPMDKISLQDLNAFKQARLNEVSKTTCRDELMMIRRVFKWYISEHHQRIGDLIANPSDLLTMPKASKSRDRVVTREELKCLLGAMSPQMAIIVELAYETAMRRSELLKLTAQDLFLNDRFLRVVDGKEGARDVPLTRRAVELLKGAQERSADHYGPLFNVASYSLSQAVRRARVAVGLDDDVRFHQLRHSRITEVARKGVNQLQLMMVSGHRDIRSVQRYTHLSVKDVIDLLD